MFEGFAVPISPSVQSHAFKDLSHVKNPKHWQPYHCINYTKILHTPIGLGSTALAAAVPYSGKATQISYEGQ